MVSPIPIYAFGRWQIACTGNKKITGGVVFLSHEKMYITVTRLCVKYAQDTHPRIQIATLKATIKIDSYVLYAITYHKIRVHVFYVA